MSWVSGIVVYTILWWLVFFAVLPWGVRVPDETEPGFATSAPERPRLWLKVGITSLIAAALWIAADQIIRSDLISFR